jgi:hypothetical protein
MSLMHSVFQFIIFKKFYAYLLEFSHLEVKYFLVFILRSYIARNSFLSGLQNNFYVKKHHFKMIHLSVSY